MRGVGCTFARLTKNVGRYTYGKKGLCAQKYDTWVASEMIWSTRCVSLRFRYMCLDIFYNFLLAEDL